MKYDYRPFIGAAYEPPVGCFRLVQRVFEDAYGIQVEDHADAVGQSREARAARFHHVLAAHCVTVTEPQEGDVIIINIGGKPAHIGIVVEPGWMLHAYEGGSAVIESYRAPRWRARINGFWRYRV